MMKTTQFLRNIVFSALLACGNGFAEEAQTADTENNADLANTEQTDSSPATSSEAEQLKLVTQSVADQLIELSTDQETFVGLFANELSGNPQGAIILVHDIGKHLRWPHTLESVRQSLLLNGWSTLSIALPQWRPETPRAAETSTAREIESGDENDPIVPPQKERAAEDAAATEQANAEATVDVTENEKQGGNSAKLPTSSDASSNQTYSKETLHQRIAAAANYLQKAGIFNIVLLGEGFGAIHSTAFVARQPAAIEAQRQLSPVQALILLNAHNQFPQQINPEHTIVTDLLNVRIPVLDLYFSGDYRNQKEAEIRKRVGRRIDLPRYSQVRLPPTAPNWTAEEDRLTRRIRGWLKRYAAGEQIKARLGER